MSSIKPSRLCPKGCGRWGQGRRSGGLCRRCFLEECELVERATALLEEQRREEYVERPTRSPRFVIVDGVEYEVIFDGSQR